MGELYGHTAGFCLSSFWTILLWAAFWNKMNKHLHIIHFCLSHWYFWAGELERQCFTTIPNTKKFVENNLLCIFLQLSSWFLEMQQTWSVVFIITSIKPSWILSFKWNQTRFRMQFNHSGCNHEIWYRCLHFTTMEDCIFNCVFQNGWEQ